MPVSSVYTTWQGQYTGGYQGGSVRRGMRNFPRTLIATAPVPTTMRPILWRDIGTRALCCARDCIKLILCCHFPGEKMRTNARRWISTGGISFAQFLVSSQRGARTISRKRLPVLSSCSQRHCASGGKASTAQIDPLNKHNKYTPSLSPCKTTPPYGAK